MAGADGTRDIHAALVKAYPDRPLIKVASLGRCRPRPNPGCGDIGRQQLRSALYVFANEKAAQARVVAVLDNLGKGAGGAAVQNMNIMLGMPETTGL